MEIRELRQDTITAAEADELARLRSLVDPRRAPDDPPVSRQLAINDLRIKTPSYGYTYWAMFDGDIMVGLSEAGGARNGPNTDACEVGLWIDPQRYDETSPDFTLHHHLFNHVDAAERATGRTRYWPWGNQSDPATRQYWETELGYTQAYDERISRCIVADTDADLMQRWIDQAGERASGYHLVSATAPFDDQTIEYYAQGLETMNDAPLDDIVQEPEPFDAARARDIEALFLALHCTYRATFAIETATGELAGYTALRIPDAEPAKSKQGDTVTVEAHRNRGIGRWLKADMWSWLRTEHPQVESLDTGNAESNRAMLAINEAMGFCDILHHAVWHKLD